MVDINALFADRNFQNLLAGIGSSFGRGGAGEAIGQPVIQMNQAKAAQEATTKQNKTLQDLLAAFAGKATPAEMPGPTSLKVGPDGKVTMDMTLPSDEAAGGVPTAKDVQGKLSDILPFF
jgi:hypothetical protein